MKTANDYKVINGTYFDINTPNEVCNILSDAINSGRSIRLKLYYGDIATGKDWNEEHDTVGYIGRSSGNIKIPLLIHSENSHGGGAILDNCILKIKNVRTKRVLYQAANYAAPTIDIVPSDLPEYEFNTNVNGELYGRHKSLRSAKRLQSVLS